MFDRRVCRPRISGQDRALGRAMCAALRTPWDLDDAARRVLALDVDERALQRALESARRLHHREGTEVSARAERALERAVAAVRSR